MSDPSRESADPPVREAAEWYARLRAADVSELDGARFRAWIGGDAGRRREFEAMDALWDRLAALESTAEVAQVRNAVEARRGTARNRVPTRWRAAAVSVGLALALVASGFWMERRGGDRYVTSIGEQRSVLLEDGSVVTLNTGTEIRLRYSSAGRDIDLVAGQASFQVARDARRPFTVTTDQGSVRALGTVFEVYRADKGMIVTLIEGKVAVTPDVALRQASDRSADPAREFVLVTGQQLSFSPAAGERPKVTQVDVARATAWRERKLDLSDTPLAEAIAEANRYSRLQIVLDDPTLAASRISGTFEAGRNDVFVEGLQSYFGLQARYEGEDRVVLARR
jgi:transmembrane sensor